MTPIDQEAAGGPRQKAEAVVLAMQKGKPRRKGPGHSSREAKSREVSSVLNMSTAPASWGRHLPAGLGG